MRQLLLGLIEFREHNLPLYAERFRELSAGQEPDTLFITCADSRVAPNLLASTEPGELFTMRNVGNLMPPAYADGTSSGDLSEASAVEYAVSVLKVSNIIVCGHYRCSGVEATLRGDRLGLSDNWLRHVQDVREKHEERLNCEEDFARRSARLCELNVIEQVVNVCQTTMVRDAWERGQALTVHGWVYGIHDGLLNDLHTTIGRSDELSACYEQALQAVAGR